MKAVLAAAVLLAFMPPVHAQDKGKSDMTMNGEFRVRDVFEQNEAGNSSAQPAHHNGVEQRFKMGMGWKANEKFSFNATLLQGATWGQPDNTTMVGDRASNETGTNGPTTGDNRNFLGVNEAYATWMMTDMFHAKFGRMNYAFGDGSVMSVNDYQPQPYSFDGVTLNYELEFGKFTLFGFKYRDFSTTPATPATTSDPQHDAYGLVFDLKTMPDWLKMVNAHVIQDTADAVWGGTDTGVMSTTKGNVNALRYGVGAGFNWGLVDLSADAEMVTGKTSAASGTGATPATGDTKLSQSMYQAQLGFNLPNLMMSRIYVGYHTDSGTSNSDKTAGKNNTYDGYFHDLYSGSGNMQLVGWGNLTDITAGWTVKPMDTTTVGLAYHKFTKTNSEDRVNAGVYGAALFPAGANTATNSSIGSEIDLWAEHKYEGGLSMMANIGMFSPDSALKDTTINKTSTITQVTVAGKFTF